MHVKCRPSDRVRFDPPADAGKPASAANDEMTLLICGGARGQACGMCSTFLSGSVLVCAGAQPYLGARIVSGDEMIDGVLSPRDLRPLGLWRPTRAGGVGGGSIAGAGRKGIGLMIGERAVIMPRSPVPR